MLSNDSPVPAERDLSRRAATIGDSEYTLSIEEVSQRYEIARHPRTIRTLQRYCVSGHLDARKVATSLGDKYLVTPQSVARHIAQIEEMNPLDSVATDRDQPRRVASDVADKNIVPLAASANSADVNATRQSTTGDSETSRYVARLEHDLERAEMEIDTKNKQIADLLERDKETNYLVRGLQNMIAPLLGSGHREQSHINPDERS